MRRHVLDVMYHKAGAERCLLVMTDAVDDEEALRVCHPVLDLAEWAGAMHPGVHVQEAGGRKVGLVGEHGDVRDDLDRCVKRAGSFQQIGDLKIGKLTWNTSI